MHSKVAELLTAAACRLFRTTAESSKADGGTAGAWQLQHDGVPACTPVLHTWPLQAQDAEQDLAWLQLMTGLGCPLYTINDMGSTLLHRAVEVCSHRSCACSCTLEAGQLPAYHVHQHLLSFNCNACFAPDHYAATQLGLCPGLCGLGMWGPGQPWLYRLHCPCTCANWHQR